LKINVLTPRTSTAVYLKSSNLAINPNHKSNSSLTINIPLGDNACVSLPLHETLQGRASLLRLTILMPKIAVVKAEIDDSPNVLRWLDRMLIGRCQTVCGL